MKPRSASDKSNFSPQSPRPSRATFRCKSRSFSAQPKSLAPTAAAEIVKATRVAAAAAAATGS